jgi:hypothetical protein
VYIEVQLALLLLAHSSCTAAMYIRGLRAGVYSW